MNFIPPQLSRQRRQPLLDLRRIQGRHRHQEGVSVLPDDVRLLQLGGRVRQSRLGHLVEGVEHVETLPHRRQMQRSTTSFERQVTLKLTEGLVSLIRRPVGSRLGRGLQEVVGEPSRRDDHLHPLLEERRGLPSKLHLEQPEVLPVLLVDWTRMEVAMQRP